MIHKTLGNQPQLLSVAQGWLPGLAGLLGIGLIAFGYSVARARRHND